MSRDLYGSYLVVKWLQTDEDRDCACFIHCCISNANHSVWHMVGIQWKYEELIDNTREYRAGPKTAAGCS